jgi:hypothetical protein
MYYYLDAIKANSWTKIEMKFGADHTIPNLQFRSQEYFPFIGGIALVLKIMAEMRR